MEQNTDAHHTFKIYYCELQLNYNTTEYGKVRGPGTIVLLTFNNFIKVKCGGCSKSIIVAFG